VSAATLAIEAALWNFVGKAVVIYFVVSIALGAVNGYLRNHTDIGRDETDPPQGRSYLLILTDHATGCQYLTSGRGGLTPRLDASGQHMCSKTEGQP
jgi:hypothetical protein